LVGVVTELRAFDYDAAVGFLPSGFFRSALGVGARR